MSNIPQEYLTIRHEEDFGFSAVDEIELKQVTDTNTLETKVIRETVSSSSEAVTRLEEKVDSILQLYKDGKLGLEAERTELLATTSGKLKELEQIIKKHEGVKAELEYNMRAAEINVDILKHEMENCRTEC